MLRLATLTALLGATQAAKGYIPYKKGDLMADYSEPYRALDCTECIQAQGKMCGKKDGSSVISVTGSSNPGHGACCKADNVADSHCKSEGDYVCSPPVLGSEGSADLKNVLTKGMNMQMIAYCPNVTPKSCALTGTNHELTVKPGAAQKITLVGATQILAKKGTTKSGLYGACYYEFSAEGHKSGEESIQFHIVKSKNVEAYLYGGSSRKTATVSVVEDNAKLVEGEKYHAPGDGGALLTVLPMYEATSTEFEVEYTITKNPPPKSKGGMGVGAIVGIAVGVCAVLIIVCAIMKVRQNKKDNTVQVLAQESVDDQPQNNADKENADDTNVVELKQAE